MPDVHGYFCSLGQPQVGLVRISLDDQDGRVRLWQPNG